MASKRVSKNRIAADKVLVKSGSFYRHFKASYEEKKNEIEQIKHKINQFKEKSIEPETKKVIEMLENKLKDLEKDDIFLNFDIDDTEHLIDFFETNATDYKILDNAIACIINLMCTLFTKIATSEENKQIDKWSYSDNSNAKRKFLANYPHNPTEYIKALKTRSPIRLNTANQNNMDIIKRLDNKFYDKELLNAYKICETIAAHTSTKSDIKKDVNFLAEQKLNKLLKRKYLDKIIDLITKEVVLRLEDYEKFTPLNKEETEVLALELDTLKGEHLMLELKKLKSSELTPEKIWDNIL